MYLVQHLSERLVLHVTVLHYCRCTIRLWTLGKEQAWACVTAQQWWFRTDYIRICGAYIRHRTEQEWCTEFFSMWKTACSCHMGGSFSVILSRFDARVFSMVHLLTRTCGCLLTSPNKDAIIPPLYNVQVIRTFLSCDFCRLYRANTTWQLNEHTHSSFQMNTHSSFSLALFTPPPPPQHSCFFFIVY